MARKLGDWIDAFIDWSSSQNSPKIYRQWAGIAVLGAALERRVWTRIREVDLSSGIKPPPRIYPNTYTMLVGAPSSGKTQAIIAAAKVARGIEKMHVGPSSCSGAALIDELKAAQCGFIRPEIKGNQHVKYNALSLFSNDLMPLLPVYDPVFVGNLNDIWDNPDEFKEAKRRLKEGSQSIKYPTFNLLAGTTFAHLGKDLKDKVWEDGLMARTFVIHSTKVRQVVMFDDTDTEFDPDQDLHQDDLKEDPYATALINDLEDMRKQYGYVGWRQAAKVAANEWSLGGYAPVPDHPLLEHSIGRRPVLLAKLALICSMSRDSHRAIELKDYERAKALLLGYEKTLPRLLAAISSSEQLDVMKKFVYWLKDEHKANGTFGVPITRCYEQAGKMMSFDKVKGFLNALVEGGAVGRDDRSKTIFPVKAKRSDSK